MLTGFKKESSSFSAVIELGTGKQGKPAFSHKTITDNCLRVRQNRSPLKCVLMYSDAVYFPYMPLCQYETSVEGVCKMLVGQEEDD